VESLIRMKAKIDESYIQQGFPDHLAGFYTYLGSIPRLACSRAIALHTHKKQNPVLLGCATG
jgi:hypothetical protein